MSTQEQVRGYSKLTEGQIYRINEVKKREADVINLLESMRGNEDYNQRSLSIAITEIQTGFMWAVRSVARPNGE